MTHFDRLTSQPGIRDDVAPSFARAWDAIASAGTWWTGAERVALAAETRAAFECALCTERKAALSPYGVDGEHDTVSDVLPPAAIEVIHRIATDPARLKREWFDEFVTTGSDPDDARITAGQYVECIGVLTQVLSIDVYFQALSLELEPLPTPQPGEPTRYAPPGAALEEAWVPMVKPENLAEADRDLYPQRTGNVVRALSLVPEEVRGLKNLSASMYLPMEDVGRFFVGRELTRPQIELIAGRVSALHECFY